MFLRRVVEATYERLHSQGCQRPVAELEMLTADVEPPRDFVGALTAVPFALIAEIKRASPSKGWLSQELNAAALARSYEQGGAAALSVLTEPRFFHGSPEDLIIARRATALPVLCKDFILDPRQIYEARLWGADAILLITAILFPEDLAELLQTCQELRMGALVEVHGQEDLDKALTAGACLIGINNRNLEDLTVDIETTFRLLPRVPQGVTVISESGIRSAADIARLRQAGVRGALVGEALVTSADPEQKLRELLG